MEIKVGKAYYVTQFSGAKRKRMLQKDSFFYIPVEAILTALLHRRDVHEHIQHFHGSADAVRRDICDGDIFRNHPIFTSDKTTLQIIAYFDEVELCNPLGSATKTHKLGCVFFTLGNIHPSYRSSLKGIFLSTVAVSPVIQKHGCNSVLKPFIDDIKKLSSQGFFVTVGGNSYQYRAVLLAFLADNLAAHQIGGFKESMSFSLRICRTCMATTEKCQIAFQESLFELRSPEKHDRQCQLLEGPLKTHHSTTYGINRRSILETVPHFSVVRNLPHDIMHDLFEGVVPYEMKLLLTYCIENKYFSCVGFNNRLQQFDFGYTEIKDKPSLILNEKLLNKPDNRIRQSASQTWLLSNVLPFLISDFLPDDCEHNIADEVVDYLGILIEEHHCLFRSIYPAKNIIPKMHYMVHYPSQIRLFGPLIYSWTMRHEAKLSVIKRCSRHGNFKNIALTVSKRHQHLLCYHLNVSQPLFGQEISYSKPKLHSGIDEPAELLDYLRRAYDTNSTVEHYTWIKIGFMHLKINVFLCMGMDILYPEFAKVIDIIRVNDQFLFHLHSYNTISFDNQYLTYVVKKNTLSTFKTITSIPKLPILHSRRSFQFNNTNIYLSPKQFLCQQTFL